MKDIRLILLCLFAFTACKSQKQNSNNGCTDIMCTEEFQMIPVKLISTSGKEVSFKSYKIIETATGKEIKNNAELPNTSENTNTLIVADDSHRKEFAERGTDLQLQITRSDDKIIKVAFKISGGKCACHVAKLNGPDQVDMDSL
ncbi:hypothetical protein ABDD95_08265 [Mucilaginibacter sp. PAMB04274]|uniref:hypothetical protein n=1 Tax=Mucilaginibacter sp. PAMB04274 TaxID=3138568 RepID=UPI0031F603E9